MREEEIDDSVATLAYYSKGRFNPQWIETLSYRRRFFYTAWLRKQLVREEREYKKAMKQP